MSMAFVAFGRIVLAMMPIALELFVWMGMGGCGCPISTSVARIATAFFTLMKRAPNSALVADDIALITFVML